VELAQLKYLFHAWRKRPGAFEADRRYWWKRAGRDETGDRPTKVRDRIHLLEKELRETEQEKGSEEVAAHEVRIPVVSIIDTQMPGNHPLQSADRERFWSKTNCCNAGSGNRRLRFLKGREVVVTTGGLIRTAERPARILPGYLR